MPIDQVPSDVSATTAGGVGVLEGPRPGLTSTLGSTSTVPANTGFSFSEAPVVSTPVAPTSVESVSRPQSVVEQVPGPVVVAPEVVSVVPQPPVGFDAEANARAVANLVSSRATEGITGQEVPPPPPLVNPNVVVTENGYGITPRSSVVMAEQAPVAPPTVEFQPQITPASVPPVVQQPAVKKGGFFSFLRRNK